MKLITALSVLLFATAAVAVDVPDFSFKGEEIASFGLRPSFEDVNLSISVQSEYTNYIEKESIGVADDEMTGDYEAEEPSAVYGSRATTRMAAIFVGDKAYRNFLVRKYIQKAYEPITETYPNYRKNLKTAEYQEEAALIYNMSRLELNDKEGEKGIRDVCVAGNYFKAVACDKYAQMLWERGSYEALITLAGETALPAYSFSAAVLSALQMKDYDKAQTLLDENPEQIFNHPDFNDLRAVLLYYKSNYAGVARILPYTTDNVLFVTADSLINLERFADAAPFVERAKGDDKHYLSAKLAIGLKKYNEALPALKTMASEEQLFNLLHYYASRAIPNMSQQFMSVFNFKGADKKDYPAFYMGLQNMELKNYTAAVSNFNRVNNPDTLTQQMRFYRGIALSYTDPSKAEPDIISTINYSKNPEETQAARFMLAQLYHLQGKTDEAAQLIDGCTKDYCIKLFSEIAVSQGRYNQAIAGVKDVNTDEARMIRATAYYNMKDYGRARQEANAIKIDSRELTHLKMLLLFKEGATAQATEVLKANKNYEPILYDGVAELILVGNYKLAAELLEQKQNLPPRMQLENARILAWSGKLTEARVIYRNLIKNKHFLYDALSGLVALEKKEADEIKSIRTIMTELESYGEFENKDLLLSQFASKAVRAKDNALLSNIVNEFFPDYENSNHAGEMYAARANLFYVTDRFNDCLLDIDRAAEKNPTLLKELRYMNARCLEAIDEEKALTLYRQMFADDEQYRLPSAVKIMDSSKSPEEVLTVAYSLEKDNPNLYIEGVRRFMEIAKAEDLKLHEGFIETLTDNKSVALKCAGLFGRARLLNEREQGREAARTYHEVYKTNTKDHFAKPALEAAHSIYIQLNSPDEAAKIKALMK